MSHTHNTNRNKLLIFCTKNAKTINLVSQIIGQNEDTFEEVFHLHMHLKPQSLKKSKMNNESKNTINEVFHLSHLRLLKLKIT